MDRREFIRQGLFSGAATLLGARHALSQPPGEGRKVIVVGAGLAGLVAAYELSKLRYDVTLIEAQERVGGRVLTIRDFEGGVHAEAGAGRIREEHDLTHRYVKEFELPLIPFYPTERQFMRMRAGRAERVIWARFAASMAGVTNFTGARKWTKIQGGNDLLPKAFAERLKDKIIYNAPVLKIEQDARGVTAHFKEKDVVRSLSGDVLLAAVPFPLLAKIEVNPPFTREKAQVIRTTTYESASRVMLETKSRFWQQAGLNGFALGADNTEIWDGSLGGHGVHGVLSSYTRYAASEVLTRRTPEERLDVTIRQLERFFPGLKATYVKGISKCWAEDPWAGGAWGLLAGRRLDTGRAPAGRIFFAGEHLSGHASWMQGALQSGLMAAGQIKTSKFERIRV